jgi:hypothetical protein
MEPQGATQNGLGGVNGSAGMSKAERFEDEKRRIVDSCFNKKEEDGSCKIAPCHSTRNRFLETD